MSMPSTYGLSGPMRGPVAQPATLLGIGAEQQRTGMGLMGAAAQSAQQREMANRGLEQEHKAGNAQFGSTIGSMAGFAVGGPIGSIIGGTLGGVLGGRF